MSFHKWCATARHSTNIPGRLEPEIHQAEVVRRIFSGITEGNGLIEIAKQLNSEGIVAPKGKKWGKTTLHKILTSEAYTGTLVWGLSSIHNPSSIRLENAWQSIVERDTFNQVQALLRARAPATLHPRRTASQYLLSGLAKCGYCSRALVGQDATRGQFHYYVCGTLLKKGAGSCPALYINSQKFEALVIDKIREHILTEENRSELVRLVNEEMQTASIEQRRHLASIAVEVDRINSRLQRLYYALETGVLSLEDLAPRIRQLRQHQEQLQTTRWELENALSDKKVELADEETMSEYVLDLRSLLSRGSLTERKAFIKSFVREVEVRGKQVVLSYSIPVSQKGISREEVSVPHIVHNGGRYWT